MIIVIGRPPPTERREDKRDGHQCGDNRQPAVSQHRVRTRGDTAPATTGLIILRHAWSLSSHKKN